MFYIRTTDTYHEVHSYFPRLTKGEIKQKIVYWKKQAGIIRIEVVDTEEIAIAQYDKTARGWHKAGY